MKGYHMVLGLGFLTLLGEQVCCSTMLTKCVYYSDVTVQYFIVQAIAGHQHHGQCCQHKFSASGISIWYRSMPVTDWVPLFRYQTGFQHRHLVHSSTEETGCWTVRYSGISKKLFYYENGHTASNRSHCWRWKGEHPARLYDCGKEYTLHINNAGGGEGNTLHVHTAGWGKGYTHHVHIAGSRKELPCMFMLLVVE